MLLTVGDDGVGGQQAVVIEHHLPRQSYNLPSFRALLKHEKRVPVETECQLVWRSFTLSDLSSVSKYRIHSLRTDRSRDVGEWERIVRQHAASAQRHGTANDALEGAVE